MRKRDSNNINNFFGEFSNKFIFRKDNSLQSRALKITLIYFIIGILWILLSDNLVELFFRDPYTITIIAIVKGWFYVLITAIIIFTLISNEMSEVINSKEKMQDINALLEEEIDKKTQIEIENNQLTERLQKYKILAENANDAILFVNKEGHILEVNDAAIKIYGYTFEEFTKLTVFDLRHIERHQKIIDQMEDADASGIIFETMHYLKDGTSIPVEVSSRGSTIGDKRILLSIVRNISDRKKAEKEILYLSYHDQLTGLYNRRFYEAELRRLNIEEKIPLALIIADVNGLKLINDAFGHKAGDTLLQRIANILKIECLPNGIVSRIGGDEFVILLSNTNEISTEKIIKNIKTAINDEKSDTVILSISIGAAVKKNKFEDIDEIFKKAEEDMYKNKLIESPAMRKNTIDLIMDSLHKKSKIEAVHSKKVSGICKLIGKALNFDNEQLEQIGLAGLMHDIGKISISKELLNNPKPLNEEELQEFNRHSEVGYQILRAVNEFMSIANYVLEHHERWDGKGYPKGLKGEEISIEGRILAVADAYVYMTSNKNLSEEAAVNELKKYSGSQFDPEIVQVLLEKVLIRP
jgi:diguanylate cyclase (GGDEF)-like protein/PAS domain S-box-containing protein